MSKEWFYRVFGQEFGPIELDELKELASSGLIAPDDNIRRGSTDWVIANSMNTLRFAEPHVGAVKPPLPAVVAAQVAIAIAPTAKQATASAAAQATTTLIQAQAKYSAAEQSANLQVAWALAPNVDPAWWASIAGVGYGPIGFATVFEWAVSGRLSPTDLVKNGYYGQCIPAGNVPGLFMAVSTLSKAMAELTAAQAESNRSASLLAPSKATAVSASPPSYGDQPANPGASKQVAVNPAVAAKLESKAEPVPEQKSVPVRPAFATRSAPSVAPSTSTASMATLQTKSMSSNSFVKSTPRVVRPKLGSRASSAHSVFQLVKNPRWIGGSGIVALALVALLFLGSRSSAKDIERFHDLKQILEEVRTARAAGSKDFASLKQRAKKMAEAYAAELKQEANNRYPAKQALLFAVRDEMPRMISGDLSTASQSEKNFELRLKDAAATLGID